MLGGRRGARRPRARSGALDARLEADASGTRSQRRAWKRMRPGSASQGPVAFSRFGPPELGLKTPPATQVVPGSR
jgi:hypothetical protein